MHTLRVRKLQGNSEKENYKAKGSRASNVFKKTKPNESNNKPPAKTTKPNKIQDTYPPKPKHRGKLNFDLVYNFTVVHFNKIAWYQA